MALLEGEWLGANFGDKSSGEKESWLGTCVQGISEAIGRDVGSEVGDLRSGKSMRKIGCERWAARRCVACMMREG